MSKLCLIFNKPCHYRRAIYKMIDAEYDCDWYFGHVARDSAYMDTGELKRVKQYRVVGDSKKAYWSVGLLRLLFKKEYQTYFMQPASRCINIWLFFLLAFLFFRNKRIYVWTHGWYGKESPIEARVKLWLYRHVTGIFTYGEYAKKLLVDNGIPENKIFPIHNSLDYDSQKAIRENLTPSSIYTIFFWNNNPTIIFIGRLTKVKRLDVLIDAVAYLKKGGEFYNIVFVGDGEERERLEQRVESLAMKDAVWFYGSCYDEQANAELIYNADLCVAPGNIGLTAMHAMMFGAPCISHNDFAWQMPEFEAIRPGVTGDFFSKGNEKSLAETISKWFYRHAEKREEVRKNCYKEIDENWNPHYQIKIVKSVIY